MSPVPNPCAAALNPAPCVLRRLRRQASNSHKGTTNATCAQAHTCTRTCIHAHMHTCDCKQGEGDMPTVCTRREGSGGGVGGSWRQCQHQVQDLGFRVWGLGFRFRKHKRIRFMQGDNSWGMHIKLQNQNPNHKPQTIHPKPKIKSKHLQRRVSVPRTRICTGSAQAQPQKQPQTQHQTQAQIHRHKHGSYPKA